jgi:hypothetical protein
MHSTFRVATNSASAAVGLFPCLDQMAVPRPFSLSIPRLSDIRVPTIAYTVPAIVIKGSIRVRKFFIESLYPIQIHVLNEHKSDHDIGHLNAGIVDVILYFDPFSVCTQDSLKRVANHRITDMADVCGLIWVDGSMFHADLRGTRITTPSPTRDWVSDDILCEKSGTVIEDIEVTRAGDLYAIDEVELFEMRFYLFGYRTRVLLFACRLLKQLCEFERSGKRQITELGLGWYFGCYLFKFDVEA